MSEEYWGKEKKNLEHISVCVVFFFFLVFFFLLFLTKLSRFYLPTGPPSSPCLLLSPLPRSQRQGRASLASSAVISWE